MSKNLCWNYDIKAMNKPLRLAIIEIFRRSRGQTIFTKKLRYLAWMQAICNVENAFSQRWWLLGGNLDEDHERIYTIGSELTLPIKGPPYPVNWSQFRQQNFKQGGAGLFQLLYWLKLQPCWYVSALIWFMQKQGFSILISKWAGRGGSPSQTYTSHY